MRVSFYGTLILICLFSSIFAKHASAGSQQNTEPKYKVEEVISLAKNVEKYAAKNGARAFIIARTGRPPKDLPKGIQFTHTAIALYSKITTKEGNDEFGYAIHNLYQTDDDLSKSILVTDYPVDFFWGIKSLQAGIIIPSNELQKALINLIENKQHVLLHNPNYSVIANPFTDEYQNCTEFTLNILNAAIYNTVSVPQIKANTNAYFDAQAIYTNKLKLFLGSTFMKDVTTRDHSGKIQTATFTSIARYLEQYGLIKHAVVLAQDASTTPLIY